jgi:threonine/homoserine/homoserine lactone efflux protein
MHSDKFEIEKVAGERQRNPGFLRFVTKSYRRVASWVAWFAGLFLVLLNVKAVGYMMSDPASFYYKNDQRDALNACFSMLGIGYLSFLFLLCPMVLFIPFVGKMTPCPRALFRKSAKILFITAASSMITGALYGFACFGSAFFT